jgi:uncharacterized damage-inducible protein DinB
MIKISPPSPDLLDNYYKSYMKYAVEDDMLRAITDEGRITQEWLSKIPGDMENLIYAEGKWMLKEVVGHICDAERILAYRALRFARNDQTSLPGFDENLYTKESFYKTRTLKDIAAEYKTVRDSTISLFASMREETIDRKGIANNTTVSPRIILYFILTHERHHKQIIKDRYLSSAFSA